MGEFCPFFLLNTGIMYSPLHLLTFGSVAAIYYSCHISLVPGLENSPKNSPIVQRSIGAVHILPYALFRAIFMLLISTLPGPIDEENTYPTLPKHYFLIKNRFRKCSKKWSKKKPNSPRVHWSSPYFSLCLTTRYSETGKTLL